jgi:LacI family transcriptional regulator
MVTSEDVARLAGVSRATVSRILNGSAQVSDDLRRRVHDAVATLGYEPDRAARALVGRRSRTIVLGFFSHDSWALSGLAETSNYFYLNVLREIERHATTAGYDLLLPSGPDGKGGASYARSLRARRVAGVITAGCTLDDPRIPALVEAEIPTVFVDARGSGPRATSLASDNVAGAREATSHLIGLGHERIAVVAGPELDLTGVNRMTGVRDALGRSGLVEDPGLVRRFGWSAEDGYNATVSLLEAKASFTAVVAHSDMLAIGVLRALHERRVRVPEDVSVTGFDDIALSTYTYPPLTTVRQDVAAMAAGAMETLLKLIEGTDSPVEPITVPTQLVVRQSTAPAQARARRRRPAPL